jgi:hypothetical protein
VTHGSSSRNSLCFLKESVVMPGTKPKLVESSNPLLRELSRWETDGGAVRDPPDDRSRMEASPHTRHDAGRPGHFARASSSLLEKWRSIFRRARAIRHNPLTLRAAAQMIYIMNRPKPSRSPRRADQQGCKSGLLLRR